MKHKTPQQRFKNLQKKWDKKLEKSGFQDIENRRGYFVDHKSFYDLTLRKNFSTTDTFENTRSYYSIARSIATNYKFPSEEMKMIWTMHSEGQTLSEIAEAMNTSKQNIFNRLKKIIKILVNQ
jgi:hypothetical protein